MSHHAAADFVMDMYYYAFEGITKVWMSSPLGWFGREYYLPYALYPGVAALLILAIPFPVILIKLEEVFTKMIRAVFFVRFPGTTFRIIWLLIAFNAVFLGVATQYEHWVEDSQMLRDDPGYLTLCEAQRQWWMCAAVNITYVAIHALADALQQKENFHHTAKELAHLD
jgi:hypothetical protein